MYYLYLTSIFHYFKKFRIFPLTLRFFVYSMDLINKICYRAMFLFYALVAFFKA